MSENFNVLKFHYRQGSGGGASGRVMAFCLSEPGLNPGTDLAYILTGRWAISKEWVIKRYILFLHLSYFLSFEHCKYINCINESRLVRTQ